MCLLDDNVGGNNMLDDNNIGGNKNVLDDSVDGNKVHDDSVGLKMDIVCDN